MEAYRAIIQPFGEGWEGGVSGTAVVIVADYFDHHGSGILFYGGSLSGLEPNLDSWNCPAKNGCGVHIHSGKGCSWEGAQEGHYHDADAFVLDPWASAKYSSNWEGRAVFDGFMAIGEEEAKDLAGRAFVVHAEDGSRVGCGLLGRTSRTLAASLKAIDPLKGTETSGTVYAVDAGGGALCFAGSARGLSANQACDPVARANGCGTHVHAGDSCSSNQGGHWFNLPEDPWKLVGYPATLGGEATFGRCVATGEVGALGKPFIVHEADGRRVLCGLLESYRASGFPYFITSVAALATVAVGGILSAALVFLKRRKAAQRSVEEHQSDLELSGGTESEYTDDDPRALESSEEDDAPKFEIT